MQVAWARLNRAAATALLAVARGEPGDHVNANGDVVLDAEPLLQSMATQKGPLADLLAQRQAREIVLVRPPSSIRCAAQPTSRTWRRRC